MQATDLGKYLFYGESQDFLGLDDGRLPCDVSATAPSGRTTWTVDGADGEFTIVNEAGNLALSRSTDGGQVVSVPAAQAETFTFVPRREAAPSTRRSRSTRPASPTPNCPATARSRGPSTATCT